MEEEARADEEMWQNEARKALLRKKKMQAREERENQRIKAEFERMIATKEANLMSLESRKTKSTEQHGGVLSSKERESLSRNDSNLDCDSQVSEFSSNGTIDERELEKITEVPKQGMDELEMFNWVQLQTFKKIQRTYPKENGDKWTDPLFSPDESGKYDPEDRMLYYDGRDNTNCESAVHQTRVTEVSDSLPPCSHSGLVLTWSLQYSVAAP